jgi:tartrate/fumarate subfamily iron-sulfur-dependent hydro-lyase beta chain
MVTEARALTLPLAEKDVRELAAGQMVLLSGMLVTGRDRLHKYLFHERPPKEALPFVLEGSVLYHTGPVVKDERIIAAGPTTSNRVEMYEPWVIEHYGLRGVMGKGGMGQKTLEALEKFGCVYLHAIGGAAACLADRIKRIVGSWKAEEFGAAEAMWLLEVEDFPAVVTMDAHGRSLHAEIEKASHDKLVQLMGSEGG